jgi:SRSO17 transposase
LFRTKLTIGVELVSRAVHVPLPFRAVVADSFYGEDRGGSRAVYRISTSAMGWRSNHRTRGIIPKRKSARSRRRPKKLDGNEPNVKARWIKVMRTFRDGSSQDWWTLELDIRPFGPDKPERVVIATTDPVTLPDLSTF